MNMLLLYLIFPVLIFGVIIRKRGWYSGWTVFLVQLVNFCCVMIEVRKAVLFKGNSGIWGGRLYFPTGLCWATNQPITETLNFHHIAPRARREEVFTSGRDGPGTCKKFGYRDSEKILKAKSTYTGPLIFILDIITITFLWNHDMITELDGCNTL